MKTLFEYANLMAASLLTALLALPAQGGDMDKYYIRMGEKTLLVPSSYLNSEGYVSRGVRMELNKFGRTLPGYKYPGIRMRLDIDAFLPRVPGVRGQGPWNDLTVLLLNPDYPGRGKNPSETIKRNRKELKRVESEDKFGLKAYAYVATPNGRPIYLEADAETESPKVFECAGFGLPNPLCTIQSLWRGLPLEVQFSYARLENWRAIHAKTLDLLDSFLVSRSQQKPGSGL